MLRASRIVWPGITLALACSKPPAPPPAQLPASSPEAAPVVAVPSAGSVKPPPARPAVARPAVDPNWRQRCRVRKELAAQQSGATLAPDGQDTRAWADAQIEAFLDPDAAERAVGKLVSRAIGALHRRDFPALSALTDPTAGIGLSPSKGDGKRFSTRYLAACGSSSAVRPWEVDTGADTLPRLNCAGAFDRIFLLHSKQLDARPTYNCFASRADNNGASLIHSGLADRIYVELYTHEQVCGPAPQPKTNCYEAWRSLWLVFAQRSRRWALDEIISHYWGI